VTTTELLFDATTMLFLPDDGFQPDLQLGEEFLADSLFSPDDCVLSDVSLSDALDRRDLNLDRRDFNERREFTLNEKHFTDDKQYGIEREYGGPAEKQNYGGTNNLSCSSLHSDGDSYPNSPINDLEDSMCTEGILVKEEEPKVKQEEGVRVKVEPDIVVKQEPGSYFLPSQSLLKQPTIVFRSRGGQQQGRLLCPKLVVVKTEPKEEEATNSYQIKPDQTKAFQIKSDQTKPYQIKSDQTKAYQTRPSNTSVNKSAKSSSRKALESCLLSSSKLCNGELSLTEEEKRTLVSEGYPVPARLPLSKAEERSLKKIRRKIKNKISAQESRRKKKEYLDRLELRCQKVEGERERWRAKCLELEETNRQLQTQLQQLQEKALSGGFRGGNLDIDVD